MAVLQPSVVGLPLCWQMLGYTLHSCGNYCSSPVPTSLKLESSSFLTENTRLSICLWDQSLGFKTGISQPMGDVTMTLSIHLYQQSMVVPHPVFFFVGLWGCAVVTIHTLWWYTSCRYCHRVYLPLKQLRMNCGLQLVRNDEEWTEVSLGRCCRSGKIGIDFSALLTLSSDWPDFPLV